MKCLFWFKEKKNKEPKLYMKLNGEREGMCVVLKAILKALNPKKPTVFCRIPRK